MTAPSQPPQSAQSQSEGIVYASIDFPDPDRSETGAWLLPHNLEPRIPEFRAPDRTEAQCWELAGATWDPDFYTRSQNPDEKVTLWVQDPARTTVDIRKEGVTFSGAWKMKRSSKFEALGLKQGNTQ
jgi:hypothetical protein